MPPSVCRSAIGSNICSTGATYFRGRIVRVTPSRVFASANQTSAVSAPEGAQVGELEFLSNVICITRMQAEMSMVPCPGRQSPTA